MAYLGKYIRQILSKQEAVVLPGLGSLVLEEGKGVRSDEGRIDPPGPVVRFDGTKPNDNGRLAAEYAAGEQMDPEEARQQVLELVDAIRFRLDKGERYKLDMVGEFSRDDDNRIHFSKDPNWVIDPGLFGLSSLDLLELENEETQEAVEGVDTETPEAAGMAEEGHGKADDDEGSRKHEEAVPGKLRAKDKDTEQHAPVPGKATRKDAAHRKKAGRWRVIWIVTGLLTAVLLLILLIPSENGLEVGKDGIIIRDTEIGNEDAAGGTGQQPGTGKDVQDDLNAAVTESLQEDKAIDDGPVAPPVQENRYFIIAGSFRNLANATELADQLKAGGHASEIILTENRLYRVSVQSFATKQEALDALPALKKGEGLGNAWLLTR
jgi:hypothetical protein